MMNCRSCPTLQQKLSSVLLYNIRRICPFLSKETAHGAHLGTSSSSPVWTAPPRWSPCVCPQNSAASATRLVSNLPKFSHITPLLHSLHWLPVATHIQFQTLMIAYRAVTSGFLIPSQSQTLHSSTTIVLLCLWTSGRLVTLRIASRVRALFCSGPTVVFRLRIKTHLYRLHLNTPC